ncbi:hypothetical protein Ahy_A05g022442 [Arachis hypogaea]|uniref:Uncharacterized protein n=1 Tax=Arachis hypogaea TaxID=3818 RepID=A0A445D0R8_ARAHY|nr:hypothetical protein Ahy_A05g022442 [Arachis hypogaea]
MEFSSKEAIVISIRNYTLFKWVDYKVYESKPLTFYTKCLQYGSGTISQDHSKLDSDTIADVIRPLVEVGPSLKFNYTINYRKVWLANQKSIAKFYSWKVLRVFACMVYDNVCSKTQVQWFRGSCQNNALSILELPSMHQSFPKYI